MIIGVSGKRGVGKTLSANYLQRKYEYEKLSFADPLREIAKTLMPFVDTDFNNITRKESKFKTYDWTPREFLINLGEFMRYHDKSYWLNKAITKCVDPLVTYVFDDVRYKNEADSIVALGGKVIRIERYEKHNPYGKDLDIPSETDLDNYSFDYKVDKMWNIHILDLERKMREFVESLSTK